MNRYIPYLYQFGLILGAVSLPFSNFGMSLSGFWLAGAWLFDQLFVDAGTRRYRWSKALGNPLFWLLSSLFFIHLIGLVYTSDWNYGLHDLRIKLPLLLFPLIFFTARPLEAVAIRRALLVFVVATSAAALICLSIPLGWFNYTINNIREISIFISHIRFSILLVFASAILLLWISEKRRILPALVMLAINLSFIWVIESATGAVLFIAVLMLYLISEEASVIPRIWRRALRIGFPTLILALGGWIYSTAHNHLTIPEGYLEQLPTYTALGNPYEHHIGNSVKENTHLVWYHICKSELDSVWMQRSERNLHGPDDRGHELYSTLLRYMSSKGLTKDAAGLSSLTDDDIRNVERGVVSVLEFEHKGLQRRFDKILFELSLMQNGGNPSGNSVTQRFEFWRAAWHIIGKKPIFGVGTGDVKSAMSDAYVDIDTVLYEPFRLRAHNQYLTFWVAFGLIGVLVLLASIFIPLGVPVPERGFLFTAFCLVTALSYLTEDTLETQAGVTFVAFFSALFAAQRLAFHARVRHNPSS